MRPGPRLTLSATGLLAVGTAPAPAGGARVRLALRWPHLSVGVEGRIDAAASRALAVGRVSTSLFSAAASGCGHYGFLFGCGVFVGGALAGSGQELVDARRGVLPYVSAGPRVGLLFGLSERWSVEAHADFLISLNDLTFRDGESGQILCGFRGWPGRLA